jgi:hypothetical protein
MSFRAFCVSANMPRRLMFESADLTTAFVYAMNLANEEGLRKANTVEERPRTVDLYEEDELVISIAIVAGGLLPATEIDE